MTDSSSSPPRPTAALSAGSPLARECTRYGYRKAGRPFGPGREGLEIWLELRARGEED